MGLCRTAVQINTAKAKKYDAAAAFERRGTESIDLGYKALNHRGIYQGLPAPKMSQKDYHLAVIFDRAGW